MTIFFLFPPFFFFYSLASQDMKKHLPNESKRFEYVTEEWMSMMNFMVEGIFSTIFLHV